MFQSYLSWIPITSFPLSTRLWGHLWWTFHHSLICSGKGRILCLTSMYGSYEVRKPPKSSAGFPSAYRFLSAEARMSIFILTLACPVLTAGLEISSTSNLSFQRSSLTKTSYILVKGTVCIYCGLLMERFIFFIWSWLYNHTFYICGFTEN